MRLHFQCNASCKGTGLILWQYPMKTIVVDCSSRREVNGLSKECLKDCFLFRGMRYAQSANASYLWQYSLAHWQRNEVKGSTRVARRAGR